MESHGLKADVIVPLGGSMRATFLQKIVEKELEGALGRKISIQQGKHSGQLTLEYYGAEDLERLSEALRNLRV